MTAHERLIADYPYKTELHTHTSPVSACSHLTPKELVDAYLPLGCDALTITNHLNPLWMTGDPKTRAREYLADYEAAREAAEGTGLRILLGVEIRFPENNNDYLIYGVDPDDLPHFISLIPYGIEEFYRQAKTPRNVILQAHPFRKGMVLAPLCAIDGIESMNMHPGHNSRVCLAAQYAKEHKLPVSGGSDCHEYEAVGTCLARTEHPLTDSFDIARVIKERDLLFDLSGHLILPPSISSN